MDTNQSIAPNYNCRIGWSSDTAPIGRKTDWIWRIHYFYWRRITCSCSIFRKDCFKGYESESYADTYPCPVHVHPDRLDLRPQKPSGQSFKDTNYCVRTILNETEIIKINSKGKYQTWETIIVCKKRKRHPNRLKYSWYSWAKMSWLMNLWPIICLVGSETQYWFFVC